MGAWFLRSSLQRCSTQKIVLKNFTKHTENHLLQSLFFNKVAGLRPATLIKKKALAQVFSCKFYEIYFALSRKLLWKSLRGREAPNNFWHAGKNEETFWHKRFFFSLYEYLKLNELRHLQTTRKKKLIIISELATPESCIMENFIFCAVFFR